MVPPCIFIPQVETQGEDKLIHAGVAWRELNLYPGRTAAIICHQIGDVIMRIMIEPQIIIAAVKEMRESLAKNEPYIAPISPGS